ncbi:MAG: 2TM domain-containing protein [Hyphomicrobiaceae bacterium]|nr:2TM domain-containing protein [Hyphomicrobiaceae bacterium]
MEAGLRKDQPTEQERAERARKRVAEMKGFFVHLIVFAAVLVLLFAVNATTDGSWWVHWVFIGWGIGVAAHAVALFGRTPKFISRWEERKTREYMDER